MPEYNRTNGRTDILYFHSGYLSPWPAAVCAARNYRLRALITKNQCVQLDRETEIQKDIETKRWIQEQTDI